jgi:hypothetical protein
MEGCTRGTNIFCSVPRGTLLAALLFVAVSLGTGFLNAKDQSGTRTFMSPVVIHFTSVFFVSAICLVPSHGPVFFAVLIGATAVLGVVVSIVITVWVVRTEMTRYVPDYFAYGVLPVTPISPCWLQAS